MLGRCVFIYSGPGGGSGRWPACLYVFVMYMTGQSWYHRIISIVTPTHARNDENPLAAHFFLERLEYNLSVCIAKSIKQQSFMMGICGSGSIEWSTPILMSHHEASIQLWAYVLTPASRHPSLRSLATVIQTHQWIPIRYAFENYCSGMGENWNTHAHTHGGQTDRAKNNQNHFVSYTEYFCCCFPLMTNECVRSA